MPNSTSPSANRFRFRAWLINVKMMVRPESLSLSPSSIWEITHRRGEVLFAPNVPEAAIVMQSTGLTDKNGKESYGGDIARAEIGMDDVTVKDGEVKQGDCGRWYIYTKDSRHVLKDTRHEIIGNRYENPDLLPKAS